MTGQDPTISEARKAKRRLEHEMIKAIRQFQFETGLVVTEVDYSEDLPLPMDDGPKRSLHVTVSLDGDPD